MWKKRLLFTFTVVIYCNLLNAEALLGQAQRSICLGGGGRNCSNLMAMIAISKFWWYMKCHVEAPRRYRYHTKFYERLSLYPEVWNPCTHIKYYIWHKTFFSLKMYPFHIPAVDLTTTILLYVPLDHWVTPQKIIWLNYLIHCTCFEIFWEGLFVYTFLNSFGQDLTVWSTADSTGIPRR